MTLPVDLKSQDFFRDPSATVKRLQAAGPVVEVKLPFVGRVWMTTTQEMASRVLKDGKLFTMRKDDGAVAAMRWWMPRFASLPAICSMSMNRITRGCVELLTKRFVAER